MGTLWLPRPQSFLARASLHIPKQCRCIVALSWSCTAGDGASEHDARRKRAESSASETKSRTIQPSPEGSRTIPNNPTQFPAHRSAFGSKRSLVSSSFPVPRCRAPFSCCLTTAIVRFLPAWLRRGSFLRRGIATCWRRQC